MLTLPLAQKKLADAQLQLQQLRSQFDHLPPGPQRFAVAQREQQLVKEIAVLQGVLYTFLPDEELSRRIVLQEQRVHDLLARFNQSDNSLDRYNAGRQLRVEAKTLEQLRAAQAAKDKHAELIEVVDSSDKVVPTSLEYTDLAGVAEDEPTSWLKILLALGVAGAIGYVVYQRSH